jgi:hypothetical protein
MSAMFSTISKKIRLPSLYVVLEGRRVTFPEIHLPWGITVNVGSYLLKMKSWSFCVKDPKSSSFQVPYTVLICSNRDLKYNTIAKIETTE